MPKNNTFIRFLLVVIVALKLVACDNSLAGSAYYHKPGTSQRSANGAMLHAVLVADTNDRSLSSNVDINNVETLITNIQKTTELTLNLRYVKGSEFKHGNVIRTVEDLSVNPRDLVIFYYSGHGANEEIDEKPSMKIGGQLLHLGWVEQTLKNKRPRLFIAIADTCNVVASEGIDRGISYRSANKKNYQRLFLGYQGHIVAWAAEKGNNAAGKPGGGGFFTNAFLASLSEGLANNPNWDVIMEQATQPIEYPDNWGERQQQDPGFVDDLQPVVEGPIPVQEQLSLQIFPPSNLHQGDKMWIRVTNSTSQGGYLLLWNINSHGGLTRLLPNQIVLKRRLEAGQSLNVPDASKDEFEVRAKPPTGTGFIVAVLVDKEASAQQIIAENLESFSASEAQSALEQLRERLSQLLTQTNWSFGSVNYEILD